MKKFLILSVLIFFGINVQAETTLKFEGNVSDIEEEEFSESVRALPGGSFKGIMTFDERNLLSDESSISELLFDNDFTDVNGLSFLSVDDVSSSLTEIWINEHKLTPENLVGISPQIVSLFSTAKFSLVFEKDSVKTTVSGKLSSIVVASSVLVPPPAPNASVSRREEIARPICEMGADPQIIRPGQGTALWWWGDSVSSASVNQGIGAVTTPSDYKWFYPSQTTTYTMTAVNANGEVTSCETTIEVTNRY